MGKRNPTLVYGLNCNVIHHIVTAEKSEELHVFALL